MKRLRYTIVSLLGLAFLFSCTKIEEYDNTPPTTQRLPRSPQQSDPPVDEE